MKIVFMILCLMASCRLAHAGDTIVDRVYSGDGFQLDFLIPEQELLKVPEWEPWEGTDAPLTRDRALEIATKAAEADGLKIPDPMKIEVALAKTNRWEKDILKRFPDRCCRWFYIVRFAGNDAALKGRFTYLVSMSGAVATKLPKR